MLRKLFVVGLVLSVSACMTNMAHDANSQLFSLSSQQAGFVDIDMLAREVSRQPQRSRVEYSDEQPEKGAFISKDIFRLRSLASLAEYRGYRYFLILKEEGQNAREVGFVDSPDADLTAALGAEYADFPVSGILSIQDIQPLQP